MKNKFLKFGLGSKLYSKDKCILILIKLLQDLLIENIIDRLKISAGLSGNVIFTWMKAVLSLLNSRVCSTSSPSHLFAIRGKQKESLEHFKHVIKICPNRGHIFQKKLRNTWTAILKIFTNFLLVRLAFSM